jgi:hypothetical protein
MKERQPAELNESQWRDDAALARRVVRVGIDALLDASDVVKERIGDLLVLSDNEKKEFAFRARIEAYTNLKEPKHPLCLGVFGPPGSGKSFAVKQILEALGHALRVVNLSQLEGPGDLSAALAEVARWSGRKTPVVFFDEFDSSLAGTRLGWLQWLLAPMQDGVIVYEGHPIEMKRAVFVFAGGTADRFEDFPATHGEYFRSAKGPDFVSRLRDHVNIRGVNEWPYRRVRRAITLRLAIERVPGVLANKQDRVADEWMADGFINQVLSVGRFVHGSRSVEALVEMATGPGSKAFTEQSLVDQIGLASHVDFGPLGGLTIALSAGGGADSSDTALEAVWTSVATRLLELGEGLVYGGDPRKGGFTHRLAEAQLRLPTPLGQVGGREDAGFGRPRPARALWLRSGRDADAGESAFDRIDSRPWPTLTADELQELDMEANTDLASSQRDANPESGEESSAEPRSRLGCALVLFRMRAELTRLADAHLIFGGREFGSSGRFPGIAEEVMIGVAAGSAIYICGAFGGAARAVGRVLGLGEPWFGVPDCLRSDKQGPATAPLELAVKEWGGRFQLTHRNDLPLDYEGLVEFLRSHALGGRRWPKNGLTHEENRTLFRSERAEEITDLVVKGLRRRFGDAR